MIEAVTFDFWGTLYADTPDAADKRFERRVAVAQGFFAAAGKRLDSATVRLALQTASVAINNARAKRHQGMSGEDVGHQVARELGFSLAGKDAKVLGESLSAIGCRHRPAPIDGAGALLGGLRGKVKLAVISDTILTLGADLEQVMATHGLAEMFDHFTWSDQTLTTKPMTRQFLHTIHMLGVAPDRAVHVGDLEATDIVGAHEARMRAILVGDKAAPTAADAVACSLQEVGRILFKWIDEG